MSADTTPTTLRDQEPRTEVRLEQVLSESSNGGHIFDIDCWCKPVIEERAGRQFLVHAPAVLHPDWLPGPFVLSDSNEPIDVAFSATINEHAPSTCCKRHFDAAREQAATEARRELLAKVEEMADDVRFGGGTGTSDYWRGFNDGIDKLVAHLIEEQP